MPTTNEQGRTNTDASAWWTAAVGADTPLGSSAHAAASGAPTDSRTASSADDAPVAALPLGTSSSLLIVHKARAAVGQGVGKDAQLGEPVCPASRVSAAESARVSSWRRCEFCGWTVLPEHITGVCAVCCRSVVCRRCERDWRRVCDEPNWPAVCYTCGGTLAKGQPLHYTC